VLVKTAFSGAAWGFPPIYPRFNPQNPAFCFKKAILGIGRGRAEIKL